jgi:hypothetical protein
MKSPTDTDNWEDFLKAFESVFHHDWTTTLTNLRTIGNGTFLHPQFPEEKLTWKNRDALLAAYRRVKPKLELAVIEVQKFREEITKYETWITGEVFSEGDTLLFRADRPVQGNTTENVVLLGVKAGLEKALLPAYAKAAEKRATLRLYGVLTPNEALMPTSWEPKSGIPSVTFVTWKCHLPNEPDELPESQRLEITPDDHFSGYRVRVTRDSATQSLLETVLEEFELLQHHPRSCVIVMHGFIELLINTLIQEKCKSGNKMATNNRDYPHSVKLTILRELELLDEESFKKLTWFRKLRNDAAHEAVFTITPDKLQMFVGTRFADVSHFPLLCMDIFMNLWNAYPSLFSSKFSPEPQPGTVSAQDVKGRTFQYARGELGTAISTETDKFRTKIPPG